MFLTTDDQKRYFQGKSDNTLSEKIIHDFQDERLLSNLRRKKPRGGFSEFFISYEEKYRPVALLFRTKYFVEKIDFAWNQKKIIH